MIFADESDDRRKCDEQEQQYDRSRNDSDVSIFEMILMCPSLQGVRRCIPLCLMSCFITFAAFWKFGLPPTNGLKHAAACRGTPQHAVAQQTSGVPLVPVADCSWEEQLQLQLLRRSRGASTSG